MSQHKLIEFDDRGDKHLISIPDTIPASLTANAVALGNGTGAIKTVASLGASGQVLTSNGAGAAPSFQDPSGGGGASPIKAYTPTIADAINTTSETTVVNYTFSTNDWADGEFVDLHITIDWQDSPQAGNDSILLYIGPDPSTFTILNVAATAFPSGGGLRMRKRISMMRHGNDVILTPNLSAEGGLAEGFDHANADGYHREITGIDWSGTVSFKLNILMATADPTIYFKVLGARILKY